MKKNIIKKRHLINVSHEAIEDFRGLTTAQRLAWLDEMREFLSKTLPKKARRKLSVT